MASQISDFLQSNIDLRDARTAALATVSTIAALSAAWVVIDYSKWQLLCIVLSLDKSCEHNLDRCGHILILRQINGFHLARAELRQLHLDTGG